jgi:hypothetical protein
MSAQRIHTRLFSLFRGIPTLCLAEETRRLASLRQTRRIHPPTSPYMRLPGLHVPLGGAVTTVLVNLTSRTNSHGAVSDTLTGISTFTVVLRVSPR